jgi:hypothetical protein
MADNLGYTPGAGANIAADDVGGVHFQIVKLDIGGDGLSVPVTGSSPLPVTGPLTDAQLRASAVPVSGPLTDAQLRASSPGVYLTNSSGTAIPVGAPVDGGGPNGLATRSYGHLYDEAGGAWNRARGTVANGALVDVSRAQGYAAHDAAVAGNPLLQGARASNAVPTAVSADGDAVQLRADRYGHQIVRLFHNTNKKQISLYYQASASVPTAETIVTTSKSEDGGAVSTGTAWTVPAGKKWRVLSAQLMCRTTTAAVPHGKAILRVNTGGVPTTSSPVLLILAGSGTAAVAGNSGNMSSSYGESGIDIPAGAQISLTYLGAAATNVVDVILQIIEIDA